MDKQLQYIMNAIPEKRYKNFITTVADKCYAWLLRTDVGYATFDNNNFINILVWPQKEYAQLIASDNEVVEGIEVHDFIQRCREMSGNENIRFMVFPTKIDSYIVTVEKLLEDIEYQLGLIE